MSVFPEMDKAEIEIEEIKLGALKRKLKEIEPLYQALSVEIGIMEDDLKQRRKI